MKRFLRVVLVCLCVTATLLAADTAWKWSGSFGNKTVSMLIVGDIQVHTRRADPTTALVHMRETLNKADLVYANLEGLLVTSKGVKNDIPDKPEWTHPGPQGVTALKPNNVKVVGVANNVAYGRDSILASLKVLDANGILHTGAGKNIDEAHKPAIVERKGVKIGFLQYTARWYLDEHQIATSTAAGVAKISSRDGITVDAADLDRVRDDIKRLRSQVDIIVVSHHNRDGATAVQFGRQPAPAAPAAAAAPRGTGTRRDGTKSEEYQKQFAHIALDAGADLVFGHGTHTVQGVEIYKNKPILYAMGHSNFDQPGYENAKEGLVARVIIQGKNILRVSFVPVTRDANNDVLMLDPASEEGARVISLVKGSTSPDLPLKIEGQEVVLLDKTAKQTSAKK